jgi:hypothetical protein
MNFVFYGLTIVTKFQDRFGVNTNTNFILLGKINQSNECLLDKEHTSYNDLLRIEVSLKG